MGDLWFHVNLPGCSFGICVRIESEEQTTDFHEAEQRYLAIPGCMAGPVASQWTTWPWPCGAWAGNGSPPRCCWRMGSYCLAWSGVSLTSSVGIRSWTSRYKQIPIWVVTVVTSLFSKGSHWFQKTSYWLHHRFNAERYYIMISRGR